MSKLGQKNQNTFGKYHLPPAEMKRIKFIKIDTQNKIYRTKCEDYNIKKLYDIDICIE